MVERLRREDRARRREGVFFLDAPHAGVELLVQDKDGKTTLLLDMSQQKYVFSREGAATANRSSFARG